MADADHAPAFWTSVAAHVQERPGRRLRPVQRAPRHLVELLAERRLPGQRVERGAGCSSSSTPCAATGATNVVMVGGLAYAATSPAGSRNMPNDPRATWPRRSTRTTSPRARPGCWSSAIAPVARGPGRHRRARRERLRARVHRRLHAWADGDGVSYLGWTWNVELQQRAGADHRVRRHADRFGAGVRTPTRQDGPPRRRGRA